MTLDWLRKFPLHPATVVVALTVFFGLSVVVVVRLAMGKTFPDGYDTFLWVVVTAMGVTGAVNIGRRATDYQYQQIKAGAAPPIVAGGPTTVEVKTPPEVKPDV